MPERFQSALQPFRLSGDLVGDKSKVDSPPEAEGIMEYQVCVRA